MFATSILLSTGVTFRGDAQSDFDIVYPLNAGSDRLGVRAPEMGGLNEPCRNTAYPCDYGYVCEYYTTDGTSTSGRCVVDDNPPSPSPESTGDINQLCNPYPEPECNYNYLGPVFEFGRCTCEPRDAPNPRRGEANQRCNRAPYSPCNHSNLRPHYQRLLPSGESCTCQYFLGNGATESNDQSTGPSLGMGAPQMGGLNEPCRNTRGYECDYGLHCHYYTTDGTSTSGRCKQNSPPSPRPSHNTGGLNQLCNRAPLSPCNTDDLEGVWQSGRCTCEPHSNPSPRRGEAHGRCNPAPYSPCNRSNLQPHYQHLLPSGESCTCEYLLGDGTQNAQSSTGPRVGMSAPQMGGEGEPCRNTPGDECNNGMYCKYTNHGSWTSGVCLREYMPEFGKLGQPCDNGACDAGLHCHVTRHGTFTTDVCERNQASRGHEGERCNPLGSDLPECLDENDYCKRVQLLPTGTTYICTRKTAKKGERCGSYALPGQPTQCDTGLDCKEQNLLPSGHSWTCEEPELRGGNGQPCRFDGTRPCNGNLVCNYYGTGGPTCMYWLGNDGAASAPGN